MELTQTKTILARVAELESRITVILHPNKSHLAVVLNDRLFNTEQYAFSRKAQAVGAEQKLFRMLEDHVIGVHKAEAAKNKLSIEIERGMLLREVVPQIIIAIREWGSSDPSYKPVVYCEDKRYKVDPVFDERDEYPREISPGVPYRPGEVDLGVEYKVFSPE